MRVLIVHAHPEPASFTAALRDAAVEELRRVGHEVLSSDLYADGFDPVAKAADFGARHDPDRLVYALEQRHAHEGGTLAPDIARELDKLLAADLLILVFPVFWFSVPAILKGWIDRVLLSGVTYGGRRFYAEGGLAGRKAWPVMTLGSREVMFGPGSVHGELEPMFRHLWRGTLGYVGYGVIAPFIGWHVPYVGETERAGILDCFRERVARVDELPVTLPPVLAGFDTTMRPFTQA